MSTEQFQKVVLPFSKMDTTDDMSGLLFGLSSTHKSPTWMQSWTSSNELLSAMDESTRNTESVSPARPHVVWPIITMSMSSPAHTKHRPMSPRALLLLRSAWAYASHEQFVAHLAAHSSNVMFPASVENLSGTFIRGSAKKPSPPPHGGASFRRQPPENLPALHSPPLAGSKPSRHLHAAAAPVPYVVQWCVGNELKVIHSDELLSQPRSWNSPELVITYRVGEAPSETLSFT
uniref:Uncharacterized protein n=1 Tax=Oryza rufipogon TaxID=4529 RepID=A0A0E0QUS9_ORYRU